MDPITLTVFLAAKAIQASMKKDREAKEREEQQREKERAAAAERAERVRVDEHKRKEALERAQHCCAACAEVVSAGAAFCHKCGAASITTVGALRDRKAQEEKVRQHLIQEEKRRAEAKRAEMERQKERERQQKAAEAQARREETERRQQEIEEVRMRRLSARSRCLELSKLTYCPTCKTGFNADHQFCSGCGTKTEQFLQEWAFAYAQEEFPDIVRDEESFRKLIAD